SSVGWIFQYALVDRLGNHDLRELRLLNESQIKPALQTVAGVAEVASVGGLEKQYQLKIFPPLIDNQDISKLDSLVVGRAKDGTPVFLKDIGYMQVGYDQRRSTVDLDGTGEVVGGVVIMEQQQNVLAITRSLEGKLKELSTA